LGHDPGLEFPDSRPEKKVNRAQASPEDILVYTLKVRNASLALQKFVVADLIPANTPYFLGQHRDAGSNTIHWERSLGASETLASPLL
jgi:uncharacterized repeat protein (TIGR01451 family)